MKRKILLTGCAGFIGTNFVKKICTRKNISENFDFVIIDSLTYAGRIENIQDEINNYSNISFLKMDIRDQNQINNLFQVENFNGCINFAAESHVDRSISSPNIFIETNVMGTLNLLNASLNTWNRQPDFRFHQISTDEVYGSLENDDESFTEHSLIAPNSPYSASKASADLLVRSFEKTYGLPTIITRCSNNYGPYQFDEKFIPVIIKNALNDSVIPVYGEGRNIRDWIFVDDHVEGIWKAFCLGLNGEVYNLGGNQEITNIELVKLILRKLGKPEKLIQFVHDRPGHDYRYSIDYSFASKQLDWAPASRFDEALTVTINWYKEKWCR